MDDVEPLPQAPLDRRGNLLRLWLAVDTDMKGHHRPLLGDGPGVDVMDVADLRNDVRKVKSDDAMIDAARRAFEQDMAAVTDDAERRPQYDKSHEKREKGVDRHPARGPDDECCRDRGDRAENVAGDMKRGGPDIEVFAVSPLDDPERRQIDDEARQRDRQHDTSKHRRGLPQPVDRLDHNPAGDQEQGEPIGERHQNREPVIPIGALPVCGLAREAKPVPGEGEAGEIGQHVSRVGEKRERPGYNPSRDLQQHEGPGHGRRQSKAPLARAMVMGMVEGPILHRHVVMDSFGGRTDGAAGPCAGARETFANQDPTRRIPGNSADRPAFSLSGLGRFEECHMKYQSVSQLGAHAGVRAAAPASMSRRERLEYWATLLDREPLRRFNTLRETEFRRDRERDAVRSDDSPISVAFASPLLRGEGMTGDSYGDAKHFFGLSDDALHEIVCNCNFGSTVGAASAAAAIRGTLGGQSREYRVPAFLRRLFPSQTGPTPRQGAHQEP